MKLSEKPLESRTITLCHGLEQDPRFVSGAFRQGKALICPDCREHIHRAPFMLSDSSVPAARKTVQQIICPAGSLLPPAGSRRRLGSRPRDRHVPPTHHPACRPAQSLQHRSRAVASGTPTASCRHRERRANNRPCLRLPCLHGVRASSRRSPRCSLKVWQCRWQTGKEFCHQAPGAVQGRHMPRRLVPCPPTRVRATSSRWTPGQVLQRTSCLPELPR